MIMKTTIELKGYQIVIEETEGSVNVMAVKDDETVEEFTLEVGAEDEDLGDEDDFGGADDYEDEMDEDEMDEDDMEDDMEDDDDMEEDEDSDMDEEEGMSQPEMASSEEDEKAPKLESFSSFISKSTRRVRK